MYNWIILLHTWNYNNTVNQLYPNIKWKVKKQTRKHGKSYNNNNNVNPVQEKSAHKNKGIRGTSSTR